MESGLKEKDRSDSGPEPTIVDSIKKIAAHNARADLNTEEQLLLFLQSWWSRTYNRPLKDPLLQTYSLEELIYEFYDRIERTKVDQERFEQDDVKIEVEKEKADLDWAERMEREERENEMRAEAAKNNKPIPDPTKDPANIKWMEEQMAAAKAKFGDSFGEDVELDFNE